MYTETAENTLVHFHRDGRHTQVAVDAETYARMINDGYEVIEEIATFTRLPQDPETGLYDPELRSTND